MTEYESNSIYYNKIDIISEILSPNGYILPSYIF